MEVTVTRTGDIATVAVRGNVDGLTAEQLQGSLQQQIEEGATRLVGDLSQVNYTSSAGLRVLLAILKLARTRGGDLRLAAIQPNVQKVLEMSGFTSILRVYPDVAAAVASYQA